MKLEIDPLFKYNDNTVLSTGKYKFIPLINIPAHYLLTQYKNNNKADPYLYEWIRENKDRIRQMDIKAYKELLLPCSKISFVDKKAAGIALGKINRSEQDHLKPIRYYLCKCGFYHLTSKEKTKP